MKRILKKFSKKSLQAESQVVVTPKSEEQGESNLPIDDRLGQLFTDLAYSRTLTDHIIFFLSPTDLQQLCIVNHFCKKLCEREFSKIARLNAFTTKFTVRKLLEWQADRYASRYVNGHITANSKCWRLQS
jgi:hypothetical protein